MRKLTLATSIALATCALLVGTAANSLTAKDPAPTPSTFNFTAPDTSKINVFELMGQALGEMPSEPTNTH